MKRHIIVSVLSGFFGSALLLILLSAAGIVGARGVEVRSDVSRATDLSAVTPSTFTYQGQLINSGSPVSSACDFQFSLYNALSAGSQIGSMQTVSSVSVSRGLFTALLNTGNQFGDTAFNGEARWLSIAVRCPAGGGSYTPLIPRQQLTSLPFALPGLRTFPNANNIIGGYSGNNIGGPSSYGVTIGGGGEAGLANTVQGSTNATYATIGGGVANTISGTNVYHSVIGGGYGNMISNSHATIGGGDTNTASGADATVGGGNANTASGIGSFVGGGGYDGTSIGGNQALGNASMIGGGHGNLANLYAATVGGGQNNAASNDLATVGGGYGNTASGYAATVGGGYGNSAEGDYSFAAGHNAHAYYNGSFVWSDSTGDPSAVDIVPNEFVVHASGGIYLIPNSGSCIVYTGAGGWACSSDRNLKENFKAVDGQAVLQNLSRIPISRWNSIGQDTAIQHIGPMAQDFYAAFGLGDDNLHINTVDAQGIAFAAIQGLYQENQDLKSQNADLTARVSKLEQNTTATNPPAQAEPFNVATLLSVLAVIAVGWLGLQQRRSKRGQA